MRKAVGLFLTLITAFCSLCINIHAQDNAGDDIVSGVTAKITGYILGQDGCTDIQSYIDTVLAEKAGKGAEWYVIIFGRTGNYDFSRYTDNLKTFLSENKVPSATGRQKNAIALIAAGATDGYINKTADDSVGEQGIMSWAYGLHILNNGFECSRYTAGQVTDTILSMQYEDGGWAVMGDHSDIDVTAMTVQALAPYYDDAKTGASIDRAIAYLSEKQLDDGGYNGFGGENPESSAQVIIALSSLGIDCQKDERFIKNGHTVIDGMLKFMNDDGSFSHEENGDANKTATMQALLSLTSYSLFREGRGSLYIFDKKEPLPSGTEEQTVTASAPETVQDASPDTASGTPEDLGITPAPQEQAGYKPIALIVTGGIALTVCILLFVLKKRRMSNFVAVFIVAGAAVCFILLTDFRTADQYYSGYEIIKDDPAGNVTLTIRCDTLVGKTDSSYVPADGVILDTVDIPFESGETVYDILVQAARKYNIQMQADANGYVSGIAYLYELDFGDLSGWIYHVNGDAPFVHCSEYKLSDGDRIEWLYTLALGNDLL